MQCLWLFAHFWFATSPFCKNLCINCAPCQTAVPLLIELPCTHIWIIFCTNDPDWAKYIFVNHPLCTFACWQKREGPKQSQSLVQLLPCRKVWIPKLLHFRNRRGQNNIFKEQSLTDLIFLKTHTKKNFSIQSSKNYSGLQSWKGLILTRQKKLNKKGTFLLSKLYPLKIVPFSIIFRWWDRKFWEVCFLKISGQYVGFWPSNWHMKPNVWILMLSHF